MEVISTLAHNIKKLVNKKWREITNTQRHPFCEGTLVKNIEIGITSISSVNAYKVVEIGSNILQGMVGKNDFDYSFKISSQAVTPTTTPTVTPDGETGHVEPQLGLQQQPSVQLKTFYRFLHINYVVFHPHYLIELNSSENHKSKPGRCYLGTCAAELNHLEMAYNLYLTMALYYNIYHGME